MISISAYNVIQGKGHWYARAIALFSVSNDNFIIILGISNFLKVVDVDNHIVNTEER